MRSRIALIDRRPAAGRRHHAAPHLVAELDRRPAQFEVVLRSSSLHGRIPADAAIDLAIVFVDSADANHDHDREIDAIAAEAGHLVAIDVADPVSGRLSERWPHASAHLSAHASAETIVLVLSNLAAQPRESALLTA